jgi:hypothetical protein
MVITGFSKLLCHTVDVQSVTQTADQYGGSTTTYTVIATGVKGRLISTTSGGLEVASIGAVDRYPDILLTETFIEEGNIIVFGEEKYWVRKTETKFAKKKFHHYKNSIERTEEGT